MIDTKLLRQKLIDMAMRGLLVEQRHEEGNATDLLEQIRTEKAALIKKGQIKKEKPLPEIKEEEKPFAIPDSWCWVRLGEIGIFKKGPFGSSLTKSMFVPKSDDAIKVYEQKNAIQKNSTLGSYYITRDYFESNMQGFEVFPGDIIVSCAGTIGETYLMPENMEKGIINQALMRIKLVSSVYLGYFLMYFDSVLKSSAQKESRGSALKNIPPFDVLKKMLVPLPPLAEQKRIVAALEASLKLVDTIAKDSADLDKALKFLRQKVLDMAMRGLLVEQRPEEGNATDLLEQIRAEKAALIKIGKIKKEKPLPEIKEEEKPFAIPVNWCWVRLGEIFKLINGDRGKNYPAKSSLYTEGIPFISAVNLDGCTVVKDEKLLCVSEEQYNKLGSGKLRLGDIVLCIRGSLGKHGRYPFDIGAIASSLVILRNMSSDEEISTRYLMNYLDTSLFYSEIDKYDNGTAQPNLAADSVKKLLVPLPPLAEQKRIVAKLEQINALIETALN